MVAVGSLDRKKEPPALMIGRREQRCGVPGTLLEVGTKRKQKEVRPGERKKRHPGSQRRPISKDTPHRSPSCIYPELPRPACGQPKTGGTCGRMDEMRLAIEHSGASGCLSVLSDVGGSTLPQLTPAVELTYRSVPSRQNPRDLEHQGQGCRSGDSKPSGRTISANARNLPAWIPEAHFPRFVSPASLDPPLELELPLPPWRPILS